MTLKQNLTTEELVRLHQTNQLSEKGRSVLINRLLDRVYELEHKLNLIKDNKSKQSNNN